MGNAVSNVFGGRETKKRRQQRLQDNVSAARSKLRSTVQVDTRLALRGGVEQTKAVMVSMMDAQLMRSGKPFVKADLIGILLYFAVLKGEDPLTVVRTCSAKTNDELRFIIREAMYSSESTLTALKHLGTGSMPVASYAGETSVQGRPMPMPVPAARVPAPRQAVTRHMGHSAGQYPASGPVSTYPASYGQYPSAPGPFVQEEGGGSGGGGGARARAGAGAGSVARPFNNTSFKSYR